jgi:hypothetical protein
MPSPITPAPMTTVFGRDDETVIVGMMTDSLRRARPARFSGFNLSRRCRAVFTAGWTAPQPLVNFGPRPCSCKDFIPPVELRRPLRKNPQLKGGAVPPIALGFTSRD